MIDLTPQQILHVRLHDAGFRYAKLLRQNAGHPDEIIYVIQGIWGDEIANIVESTQDTGYELPKHIFEGKPNNMSNHQTQSPDTLSNEAAPIEENPECETPDALARKVERLERRTSTLELLLNDIMIHIDNPSKSENQFASKQKPKPKQKMNAPDIKERILAYLSTETTPKGTRVIAQAIRSKFQETKIALRHLRDSQKIIYIENEGYQRKDRTGWQTRT